jgi:hypothetical protein
MLWLPHQFVGTHPSPSYLPCGIRCLILSTSIKNNFHHMGNFLSWSLAVEKL